MSKASEGQGQVRYAICPGWVTSKEDGDRHFIGSAELMRLYGVKPAECRVCYLDVPREDGEFTRYIKAFDDLLMLKPKASGAYELPRPVEPEPLPCPFCGCEEVSIEEGSTFRWRAVECSRCGARAGEVRIQTTGEGRRDQWEAAARRDAIKEWNCRDDRG